MKAYSKYVFEQSDTSQSTYILKEIHGFELARFLSTIKETGQQNIRFGLPDEKRPQDKGFDKIVYGLGRITGIKFSTLAPGKTFGDTANPTMKGNDCLLLEFSDNSKVLTVYVIKDMANQKKTVFEKWLNGDILESVYSELLPLNKKSRQLKN